MKLKVQSDNKEHNIDHKIYGKNKDDRDYSKSTRGIRRAGDKLSKATRSLKSVISKKMKVDGTSYKK